MTQTHEQERRINCACTAIQNYDGAENDRETALRDLLTDLRHWAECYAVDYDAADVMATAHYNAEVGR